MIAIIDYKTGNISSIVNMLKKIGHEAIITDSPDVISAASGLVLPGVGSFDIGMDNLVKSGLRSVLDTEVLVNKKPVLGICLGMQLMCKSSEEGKSLGLGWVDAEVVRFPAKIEETVLRIPHIGWNEAFPVGLNDLFSGFEEVPRFYFVHSYYIKCNCQENILAKTNYHMDFTSAFGKGNIFGVQFHPEKSHKFGMKLLTNFMEHCIC